MRLFAGIMTTASTILVLVAGSRALSANSISGNSILRADDVLDRPYSALIGRADDLGMGLVARGMMDDMIIAADNESVKINANGTLDLTVWNNATNTACRKALAQLKRSTNPSGNCLCYNLPSLDVGSGVFEADLRLYRISEPREAFANVSPKDVKVGVQYNGASVSPVSPSEVMGMGVVENRTKIVTPRDEGSKIELLQTYMFVGQIDKEKLAQNMSMAKLEAVLMPTFTLTANTGGKVAQTNVSLNEASFLTGVFSKSVVMSDFSAAQAAVTKQVDALSNGTIAFILPGVQIMVFPIGAIITGVWLVLGLTAYGIGTYERMNYAEMYKRQLAATSGGKLGSF